VMKPLPFEDQRYLEAAQGWFELGNVSRSSHRSRPGLERGLTAQRIYQDLVADHLAGLHFTSSISLP
jgi:hypothetical protein